MKSTRCSFAVILLAASLFLSTSSFADPVTIKGHRLAEISDIVKAVTSSDFPEIQKHSLLLYERFTPDSSNVRFLPRIFAIGTDGSLKKQYDADYFETNLPPVSPTGNVVQKMNVSISPKRFGKRYNVVYTTAGLRNECNSLYAFTTLESSGTGDDVTISREGSDFSITANERNIWGNAYLTVKGMESQDVFVAVHSDKMAANGSLYFKFLAVDRSESGKVGRFNNLSVEGDGGYSAGWRAFDYAKGIWGVDVAVGDFDGDGYKNEILIAWNDNTGVFAYIYQVKSPDGKKLKVDNLLRNEVHVGAQTWGLDYTKQSALTALAGDFDGDGVQEAAVVTRTNGLKLVDMRVKVYKYQSGSWTNSELTAYNDFLGTLKAARADLNGDGQDEIVLLVIQDVGGTLYPRLEFWGFNKGSITPVRNAHCNKGGAGDTSLLGYAIGGGEYNQYYKTGEDFSITAGPLTGVVGHVKFAEDIAISHVNSDISRVFIISPVLNANRDFTAFGETKKIYENAAPNSGRRGGLATADFTNETLILDKPSHTQAAHDESYVAVIQALPYHVDNVSTDGTLKTEPINYTFSGFGDMADGIAGKMRIAYSSSSVSSQNKSVSFNMASTTETISILGDVGESAAGYLKFRAAEANIAGNFDPRIKTAAGALNSVMNFVTDRIDKTTTNASSYAATATVKEGLDARQFDRLVTYTAPQHIWRYKILNNPLPSWYVLGPKADYVSKDFNTESKDRYITFSMYDNAMPLVSTSDNHYAYQARHEEGNFFSYPSVIDDVEGYNPGGALLSNPYSAAWTKSDTSKTVTFEQSKIDSQTYDEKIEKSGLSKTISAIASFFGAKDPSPLPPYTSHSEAFVKKYSSSEAISIDVYGRTTIPGEAARHTLIAMPYITREGQQYSWRSTVQDKRSDLQRQFPQDRKFQRYSLIRCGLRYYFGKSRRLPEESSSHSDRNNVIGRLGERKQEQQGLG